MPVSSFAPEFLELFKLAAQEERIIPLGDYKRATRLRFRLNMLRVAMRKEQHTLTTIANSVEFTITNAGDLKCSPADAPFLNDLKSAGVEVQAPHAGTPTHTPFAKPERADAEEVIRKFLNPSTAANAGKKET